MPLGQMCGEDGWAEAGLKRRNHGCQEVEGQTGVGSACGVEGGRGQSGATRGVDERTDEGSIIRPH